MKHWIWINWYKVQATKYLEIVLLESLVVVIVEKARGWFIHSRYNVD